MSNNTRTHAAGAPALYLTRIKHVRTEPVRRAYEHTSYYWFVDLDALPRLRGPLAPLAGFRGKDHLAGAPGDDLRTRVDAFLAGYGVDLGGGRVTAVMNARMFGYVFNPLTVYWCHDRDDRLVCVIAEVHNTYGERHSYLLEIDRRGRASAEKAFYVSPFNDTAGRYRMALPEPGTHLTLDVSLHRDGHDPFVALVTGDRIPATGANVLRAQLRAPWAPMAVSAFIRAEGIRLWAKGLPLQPRPAHPRHSGTDARPRAGGASPLGSRTTALVSPGAGDGPGHDAPASTSVFLPAAPRTLRARVTAPVVSALFRRIARELAAHGTPIRIELPDGAVIGDTAAPALNAPPAPRMVLRDPDAFARRVGADGLIGFGEAYMAGDWTSPDLAAVLTALATRMAELVPPRLQFLRPLYVRRRPVGERNTAANARRNIAAHYDLSNDFFAAFLDETMTYSSALFTVPPHGSRTCTGHPESARHARSVEPGTEDPAPATSPPLPADTAPPPHFPTEWPDLAAAQRAKIDRLLDAAGVGQDTRLLEIGTGWGELCIRAAARGARVLSVTLSHEQQDEARSRVEGAGLADRVDIELRDYRDVTGQYDAIVSVEMIEAVGHEYWAEYVQTLDRLLAPGGRIAVQAITMPHDRMLRTRDTYTWIQKYIFPGGFLPSIEAIADIAVRHTGLQVQERFAFGEHYAHTLRLWDQRCEAHSRRIDDLGFDRTFRRMWHFYLCYSEAGFRSGYLDVQQIMLARPGDHAAGECPGD